MVWVDRRKQWPTAYVERRIVGDRIDEASARLGLLLLIMSGAIAPRAPRVG